MLKNSMIKIIPFLFVLFFGFNAHAQTPPQTTIAAEAVIIDMGTGMTLMSKNADKRMPTSSMSKVMTAYMVFEALKQGRVDMATKFPVSKKAWAKGGSKMFLGEGTNVSVEDLLKGLIVDERQIIQNSKPTDNYKH